MQSCKIKLIQQTKQCNVFFDPDSYGGTAAPVHHLLANTRTRCNSVLLPLLDDLEVRKTKAYRMGTHSTILYLLSAALSGGSASFDDLCRANIDVRVLFDIVWLPAVGIRCDS